MKFGSGFVYPLSCVFQDLYCKVNYTNNYNFVCSSKVNARKMSSKNKTNRVVIRTLSNMWSGLGNTVNG